MKINNFLLALVLIAAQPSMVFCAQNAPEPSTLQKETKQETRPELSYWQMYAPQFMQDATSATSGYIATWIPQSVKNTVGNWSTKKQLAVLGAIVGVLATIGYNKEALMSLVSNSYNKEADDMERPTFIGTPEEYALMQEQSKQRRFESEVQDFMDNITNPRNTGVVPMLPKQIVRAYESLGEGNNPAFKEAVKRLDEQGMLKY